MRVLIVDDSTTMRRLLKNQLEICGIADIIEAANGEDAIDKLAGNMPVDLVTMDINMPVMDGFTCLKQIRAKAEFAGVKVVMVTSEAEKSKVIECIKAGANNYLTKPFTPEGVKEKLGL